MMSAIVAHVEHVHLQAGAERGMSGLVASRGRMIPQTAMDTTRCGPEQNTERAMDVLLREDRRVVARDANARLVGEARGGWRAGVVSQSTRIQRCCGAAVKLHPVPMVETAVCGVVLFTGATQQPVLNFVVVVASSQLVVNGRAEEKTHARDVL